MISSAQVHGIQELHAAGNSQRQVALLLGLHRRTVRAALSRPPGVCARQRTVSEEDPFADLGPVGRCPGCGGMVILPCWLCRVRALSQRTRWVSRTTAPTLVGDSPRRSA